MANNYEITMKQYNGNDYDTLYPKNVSQQVLLNSSDIANQLGLIITNPTVADAISKLQSNIYDDIITRGSYIGTGTYGPDHPNQLTFDFVPRLIIIINEYNATLGIFVQGILAGMTIPYGTSLDVVWAQSGKNISWYVNSGSNENVQLNTSGRTYTYIAI